MSQISRVTTWVSGQILKAADLNGEFNNIVNAWNNIDTASSSWTNQSISGTLAVTGAATLSSTLAVTGATTLSSTLAVTGVITFASGTAAAPSLAFSADTTTGFYRVSAGKVGISGSGAQIASFVTTNNGTLNLPSSGGSGLDLYAGSGTHHWDFHLSGTNLFANDQTGGGVFQSNQLFSPISGILGSSTNDNASAGNYGEYVVSAVSSFSNTAATTVFGNITTISLTAGDWDVVGQTVFNANGATVTDGYATAVSINSGNTTTDHVKGTNVLYGTPGANNNMASTSVVYRISLSGTTTVYLKAMSAFSAGQPQVLGTIRARRIR